MAGNARGRALALTSALCYGATLPLSRLAFDEGTNALTVATLRYLGLAVALSLWLRARAQAPPPGLSGAERGASALLGALFCAVSLGTLLGISYMSVSLTTMVFYTHPSMVLVAAAALDRRRPQPGELLALVMAFGGLGLALDLRLSAPSPAGLAFAFMAAAGALGSFVVIERALSKANALRATALAATTAAALAALALLASDGLSLPQSPRGWALLALVVLVFGAAVVCMFAAIRRIGSVKASLLLFLEPLTAVLLAVALLGEALTLWQWLGAGLVIGAVVLASVQAPPSHAEEVLP